jgi:hypothetical protein
MFVLLVGGRAAAQDANADANAPAGSQMLDVGDVWRLVRHREIGPDKDSAAKDSHRSARRM